MSAHIGRLGRVLADGSRVGLIFNALDEHRAPGRPLAPSPAPHREPNASASALAVLGVEYEELDLRDYFYGAADLRERLEALDVVWVAGGNTFVLARAMLASGFRAAATPVIGADRLLYVGYSAGACVTAPDLRGIERMDDPSVVPDGYPLRADEPNGLGWIPWRIVPHWRADGGEPGATAAAEHLTEARLAFRTLADGDAISIGAEFWTPTDVT